MNRDLPLIPSLVFIASLIICIALYMQRVALFSVPSVGQFLERNGEVHVLFKNQLINLEDEFDNVSLATHGIKNHVGQVGLADDGALFINTAGQWTSLLHKWRRFQRQQEPSAKHGKSSLLSCDSDLECQPWGDEAFHFNGAWSMFDAGQGRYLINDIERHRVHLADADGRLLDTLRGFRFPNQLFLMNNSFWLVNTNTNSFIELEISDDALKRSGSEIDLGTYSGIPSLYKFPSSAYSVDRARLLALIHPNAMNYGRVFELNGGSAKRLFADLNDITAIYFNREIVFVADYETHTLWRQKINGGEPELVNSESYLAALETARSVARSHWADFIVLVSVIFGVGIIALVIALAKSKSISSAAINIGVTQNQIIDTAGEVIWVESDTRYMKQFKALETSMKFFLGLSVILIFLITALALYNKGFNVEGLGSVLKLVGLVGLLNVIMYFVFAQLKGQHRRKLGWDGRDLHFGTPSGEIVVATPDQVFYSRYQISAKGVSLPIQMFNNRFFDKQSFETIVLPTLLPQNQLGALGLFMQRLKAGGSEIIKEVIGLIALIVLAVLSIYIR